MAYYYVEKPPEHLYKEVHVIHNQLKNSLNRERRLIYMARVFDTVKQMEEKKEWRLVEEYLRVARPFVKEAGIKVKLPAKKEERTPLHAHSDFKRVKVASKSVYNSEKEFIKKLKRLQGKQAEKIPDTILSLVKEHMSKFGFDAGNISPKYISTFLRNYLKHGRYAKHSNRIYFLLTGDVEKRLYDLDPAQKNFLIENHSGEKDVQALVERFFARKTTI